MNGTAWRWFGLDLFDAWAEHKPAAERVGALEFLAALAAVPFPDYPGDASPDGPAANHRVADDGTYRAVFVADRRTIVGALYLAALRGPGDQAPRTRPTPQR